MVRLLVPALMLALAGIASAQATAPTADAATPAPVAAPAAPTAPAAPAPVTAPATPESAVAAEPAAAASAAKTAAAPQQRCHKEYPIGSSLPKTVCTTELDPDMERARERAIDDLKHAVRSGLQAPGR